MRVENMRTNNFIFFAVGRPFSATSRRRPDNTSWYKSTHASSRVAGDGYLHLKGWVWIAEN